MSRLVYLFWIYTFVILMDVSKINKSNINKEISNIYLIISYCEKSDAPKTSISQV